MGTIEERREELNKRLTHFRNLIPDLKWQMGFIPQNVLDELEKLVTDMENCDYTTQLEDIKRKIERIYDNN